MLRLRDDLGLFTRQVLAGDPTPLLVLPEPVDVGAYRRDGGLDLAQDPEPDAVRPYVRGTPMNRVHWKSSARGGELMERTFTTARDQLPLLVVDTSGAPSGAAVDWAAREAAGQLLALAQGGGCRVLLPGDRTPTTLLDPVGGWAGLHRRLADLGEGGPQVAGGTALRPAVEVRAVAAPAEQVRPRGALRRASAATDGGRRHERADRPARCRHDESRRHPLGRRPRDGRRRHGRLGTALRCRRALGRPGAALGDADPHARRRPVVARRACRSRALVAGLDPDRGPPRRPPCLDRESARGGGDRRQLLEGIRLAAGGSGGSWALGAWLAIVGLFWVRGAVNAIRPGNGPAAWGFIYFAAPFVIAMLTGRADDAAWHGAVLLVAAVLWATAGTLRGSLAALVVVAIVATVAGGASGFTERQVQIGGERKQTGEVNWGLDYGPDQSPHVGAVFLEVQARRPALWRAEVLDRWDGRTWRTSVRSPQSDLPQPAAVPVTTNVTVRKLRDVRAVAPGRITSLTAPPRSSPSASRRVRRRSSSRRRPRAVSTPSRRRW